MENLKSDDRLELLDYGAHVAWADVVDGRWTLPSLNLAAGPHILSARYRGLQSTPWQLTRIIEDPTDTEVFAGAAVGAFRIIKRPYYLGIADVTGSTAQPGPVRIMGPSNSAGIFPGREILYLGSANRLGEKYSVIYIMEFDRLYSKVSFSYYGGMRNNALGAGRVELLTDTNAIVDRLDYVPWGTGDIRHASLGRLGVANVKKMRVRVTSDAVDSSVAFLATDFIFYK